MTTWLAIDKNAEAQTELDAFEGANQFAFKKHRFLARGQQRGCRKCQKQQVAEIKTKNKGFEEATKQAEDEKDSFALHHS